MAKKGGKAVIIHQKPGPVTKKRTHVPENDEWAVFSEDPRTQEMILKLLGNKNSWITTEISIRSRIVPVVYIPFSVVKKVMETREAYPRRILFHRAALTLTLVPKKHRPWKISKEGKTALSPYYHEQFPTWRRYWQER